MPRTLRMMLAYDGTRYAGWQTQRKSAEPTIQATIERTLARIVRHPVKVVGSGRTDAGVHARGQVAHAVIEPAIPLERLFRSLNQLLPSDIAVLDIVEADRRFHARFHAVSKWYRYRLFTGRVPLPFDRPYVHHVRIPLDVPAMRRELEAAVGSHDFAAFARAGSGAKTTTRAILRAELTKHGEELWVDLEGTGFLHTMVRSLVGTMVDVGRGALPSGTVARMLSTGGRALAGRTAPSHGLTLMAVRYRDDANG